jgi:hypothetical protein
MTNTHGQRLHIQDPQLYTEGELKWIKTKHNANKPSETFKIVCKETRAPRDPRTAVIDGIHHIVWVQTQNNPEFQPPEFYERDMRRLTEEWSKEKETWQPNSSEQEKKS